MKVQLVAVAESYTREQITVVAEETAGRLAAALGGGGLATNFVRRYAEANRRRALLAHPARHRELIERIGREALLALAARVELDLPRRFGILPSGAGRRRARPRRESARLRDARNTAIANHFRVEFYERLAKLLDWNREELEDFWRDLDLYTGAALAPRSRSRPRNARRRKVERHLGAFADRCSFLLDSSLLERARRAAAKFHRQLERTAREALRAGFRRAGIGRIIPRARPRRRAKSQVKRRKKSKKNRQVAKGMGRKKKTGGRR